MEWDKHLGFFKTPALPLCDSGPVIYPQGLNFIIYKMRLPRSCLSPSLDLIALTLPGKMPAWPLFSGESFVSRFSFFNPLLPASQSPLLDSTATLNLVKRQVPLDCVLYRYGSFSLTLDIVRESCLQWGLVEGGVCCLELPVEAYNGMSYSLGQYPNSMVFI